MPVFRERPVEPAAVDIPAVIPFIGIIVIGVVVELSDLVAAVEYGDAALAQHPGVEHDITHQGACFFFRAGGRFEAAQRGCGAAHARVAERFVVVIQLAPGGAAGPFAGQVIVQVFLI